MPLTEIFGRPVYYEVHGPEDGPAVVLLHHGFGCLQMWKYIYPQLAREGFRVIMYDRRGYGRSAGGPDFMDFYVSGRYRLFSHEEMAELMHRLGVASFHIVGQCEGGVVGLDYAARLPGQVKTLTVASTFCHSDIPMVEFNQDKFPKSFSEMDQAMQDKIREWHGARAEVLFDQFRSFGGAYGSEVFDLRPMLHLVGRPTLILYPDRSSLFRVEQAVDFYRHLPRAELAVMARCGHNTYEQRPEEYAWQVLNFIRRQTVEEDAVSRTALLSHCGYTPSPQASPQSLDP
jgi:pimeloyl-ACP methyl ester carboxylesterase